VKALGIDPGLTATGYGVVEQSGNRMTPLAWGVIRSTETTLAGKLSDIHGKLVAVLEEYHPDLVAVEEIFLSRNARSALLMGHARGVAILSAGAGGYPVREYPANTVKQAVAGRGGAAKQQVQYMVGRLLGLTEEKIAEDASDALAVAICCLLKEGTQAPTRGRVQRSNASILQELERTRKV
jgi:crossover junction endodeoxyribonuclease RuvC